MGYSPTFTTTDGELIACTQDPSGLWYAHSLDHPTRVTCSYAYMSAAMFAGMAEEWLPLENFTELNR